jgi:glycosyltransferase involved in cell wall biosynthesis
MRIAVDGRTIVKGKSGVGTYVERTMRALLDLDPHNEYFLFLAEPLDSLNAPNLTKVAIEGYQKAGKNRYWENFLLPQFAAKHKIDIFFGAAYALPLLPRWHALAEFMPLPSRWKRPFNPYRQLKYVGGVLDVIGFVRPETFTPKMRLWQHIFVANAVRIADAIITISESTKRDILRLFRYDGARIHVTPLSVDQTFHPDYEKSETMRVRNRYSLPKQFILYVGTIEPRKNVSGIAKAYSSLSSDLRKKYPLIIAGSKGWYAESILNEIKALRIPDDIRLTGFVDDLDLPILMSMAEVFVFPSLYEGFGYPVLEAMASGVPVITSTSSSLPEVIGDAGIMVDPVDTRAISEGMVRILRDPRFRASLRAKGLKRAKQFTWEKTARRTLQVFESVYSEKR